MKKNSLMMTFLLALGLALSGAAGCGQSGHSHGPGETHDHDHGTTNTAATASVQYTCPMHPEIVQDTPGKCSKCQMDLVEKR